jgi:hypothetical protein
VEEIWIDGKGAKMDRQGDTELSGRMDRNKTGMDGWKSYSREGKSPHTPPFLLSLPNFFPPRFLARGLVA